MVEIGVDIGGTFVDVVCIRDGEDVTHVKVSTRPRDLVGGVREGLEKIMDIARIEPSAVTRVVHGSTVATNAIIERRAKPIGLLMTDGFEDTLEIGRQKRFEMYDLFIDGQTPTFLSPRRLRRGIRERIDWRGEIVTPLSEDDVVLAAKELMGRYDIDAVAVCYLFSFRNPEHERRTRDILLGIRPGLRISLSSDVDPMFREYERVCLTAFDAYLKPVVGSYIVEMEGMLRELGISRPLQVMQSRGAIITAQSAIDKPVSMFLSGPAAGVVGGTVCAQASGFDDVVTMDTGGTSNDVAIIRNGKPLSSSEQSIREYPVRIPMVDISTIGAGGGSIAWVDASATLRVGPRSAGSDPGPACYGRGGTSPTVTDALLMLGYLPEEIAGGSLRLERTLSEAAIAELGEKLDLDPITTAAGILRIVNANMAEQVRLMSVKRGYDPRKFGLVVLGGGGPLHGPEVARQLGMRKILVPHKPGVLSAFGMLVADLEHHHARGLSMKIMDADLGLIEETLSQLRHQGEVLMAKEGIDTSIARDQALADMRYVGQSFEVSVPLEGKVNAAGIEQLVKSFHALHNTVYGYENADHPVEISALHQVHVVPTSKPRISASREGRSRDGARVGTRPVWWPGAGWLETPIYRREMLPLEVEHEGPAIVEQLDTTTIVPGDATFVVDASGNLLISIGEMKQ